MSMLGAYLASKFKSISKNTYQTVLLQCFAGEKPLQMSKISRKFDTLRSGKDRDVIFAILFCEPIKLAKLAMLANIVAIR